MEKQNITVALPKDVLRKVKIIAIQEGSSVSGLLTRILEDMVSHRDAFETARRDHLVLLKKELNMGTDGKPHWTREELHER
jgi:hypothetical protein